MNVMHSSFELKQKTPIESLGIVLEEYHHRFSGAVHYHMASDNPENVFLVALRTVPEDSTGVAHILEHTSLCGSKKYPVRDPFFMMIRRSLNTFMNAFTSSDWTAYPFASQSRKDFENLRAVYLDAVFFANLDPLDFAQEGCRVEFSNPTDKQSELVYKGVVFNEMKGAMSSISSQLWQAIGETLFPETTYGHNSGGDPAAITELTYEQLKRFYQKHYHPDNAIFMTYGDIPASDHQQAFHELALKHFSNEEITISVPLQKPFSEPRSVVKTYPHANNENSEKGEETTDCHSHHVMAWVLGDIRDPLTVMRGHLMSSILLENSASPLQKTLETSALGKAPSPLCGLDDSGVQMIFVCGLEGCASSDQANVEALILSTLRETIKAPPSQETLEALLDQLEMQQREITGDGYPYGLQIILSCLATAMHRGSVENSLDLDPILSTLREQIKDPDFVINLIEPLLIDNDHRCILTLNPDSHLAKAELEREAKKLATIKAGLSEAQSQEIIHTAKALQERQASEDDPELLPKVGLSDVPAPAKPPSSSKSTLDFGDFTFYPQGTNGIVYHQLICELPNLGAEDIDLLLLHNSLATKVGLGDSSYLDVQMRQSAVTGGISSYTSFRSAFNDEQALNGFLIYSAKGLSRRSDEILDLLVDTKQALRFDETQRVAELIAQSSARAQRSVTGQGHSLAMTCASQAMSPLAQMSQRNSGTLGISRLRLLEKSFEHDHELSSFCDKLANLQSKLSDARFDILSIGEEECRSRILDKLNGSALATGVANTPPEFSSIRERSGEIWICNTQVNFCAKAYPTVHGAHADAPALTVLAGVLRNGFLHTAIREQGGAYGGGASHDSSSACFRFYSYRDPRIADTLLDFDRSLEWVQGNGLTDRHVEEAILGVVSSIDKPSSPAGGAKQHFHNNLFGRTTELLNDFRAKILQVSREDLLRVSAKYFSKDSASVAVLSHEGEQSQLEQVAAEFDLSTHSLLS